MATAPARHGAAAAPGHCRGQDLPARAAPGAPGSAPGPSGRRRRVPSGTRGPDHLHPFAPLETEKNDTLCQFFLKSVFVCLGWPFNLPDLIKVPRQKDATSKVNIVENMSCVYLLHVSSRVRPVSQKWVVKPFATGGHWYEYRIRKQLKMFWVVTRVKSD